MRGFGVDYKPVGEIEKMKAWVIQENGTWVVQGADHDIVAQGRAREDAIQCWRLCVRGTIALAEKHGTQGLESYPPAPRFYWNRFGPPEEIDITGSLPERYRVQVDPSTLSGSPL